MQRVRMSLPFFKDYGWEAEIVTVDPQYSDMNTDPLLTQSIPDNTPVHYVKAFSKKWTSKFGLGSIALRSFFFYRKTVNALLLKKQYDLIYFSTTQFPVCILGAYWKRRFKVPYVIDMQDPWHSEYYRNKPKSEHPPKYWFSYNLNKRLEPLAMKKVDGLISVSQAYLHTLHQRYSTSKTIPQKTITFGAFDLDFEIAKNNLHLQPSVLPNQNFEINIVYVGRGGQDMQDAITYLFKAFKSGLSNQKEKFSRLHFYFIGTSYAANGKGIPTIAPLAKALEIDGYVTEMTNRIPFYQTLNTLADAEALFIPGSNDPQYTASKIYPYVLARKPLLALFHAQSSVVPFLKSCNAGTVVTFDNSPQEIEQKIYTFLNDLADNKIFPLIQNFDVIERYSAKAMTKEQCEVFDAVTNKL
jgi:hypothetical protein